MCKRNEDEAATLEGEARGEGEGGNPPREAGAKPPSIATPRNRQSDAGWEDRWGEEVRCV